ncbi:MAG: hypothetical protein NXI12_09785 [Alphaproteobacteria bacterium]|nr:hypothetical protein [Alphaproteobacteria bacterium]
MLIWAALAYVAVAASPPRAEIVIRPAAEGAADGWHSVTYLLPSDDVGALAIYDMSEPADHCPDIEYELLDIKGARTLPDAPSGALVHLRPEGGEAWVRIALQVRMAAPEAGLSPANTVQCDLLLQSGDLTVLEGKALLPAPRPIRPDGAPFRFGEARIRVDHTGPAISTLGAPDSLAGWTVNALDEARFAYFVIGAAAARNSDGGGVRHLPLDAYAAGRFAHLGHDLHQAAASLERLFGAPGPDQYLVLTLTGEGADFADYTGTARPGGQRLVIGPGAPDDAVVALSAHELAHHWDIARFRQLDQSEDLTWIREGLAEFIAHAALVETGALGPEALVRRANLALYNRDLPDMHGVAAYDEGYLAWFALHESSGGGDEFARFLAALIAPGQPPLTRDGFYQAARDAGLSTPASGRFDPQADLPCSVRAGQTQFDLRLGVWPAYDSGLVFDDERPGQIQHVRAGSAGDRAGMRAGDQVEQIVTGGYGRVFEALNLRLSDGRSVTFMPQGPARAAYLQYIEAPAGAAAGYAPASELPCQD